MTDKRRKAIMSSLRSGNWILRSWSGTNASGYLRHSLEGVRNLRQSEAEELLHAGIVETVNAAMFKERYGYYVGFRPYRLKEGNQ